VVKFPVTSPAHGALGMPVAIWTTTPWTLPGNRAISFAEDRLRFYKVTDGG
jgi:isoleucyl-tRNA synthetase